MQRASQSRVIFHHIRESEWFYVVTTHDGRVACVNCETLYKVNKSGSVRKHLWPSWKSSNGRIEYCPGSHQLPANLQGPYPSREEAAAAISELRERRRKELGL